MISMKSIALGALVVAMGALSACKGGGPEGKYTLDKDVMKKAMQAEIAKLPPEQQAMGGLMTALVDAMDMQIELKSGGTLSATSSLPDEPGKPPKTDSKEGTWKQEGTKIIMTIDGKPESCELKDKTLNCATDKPGEPGLVLKKI
ncbi:MAG: hypothetical protein OZ921_16325 [Sorangiineae bacterium]|nr:hypothetical protein [Polyangiaceae bacterium]MEB2324080.1 hypothetical protein [Sorangiineae bacterium]